MTIKDFNITDERFADIQILRYRLPNFESLSLQQKIYIYYLAEATLYGRDIVFDQFGRYNLRIRKVLEVIFCSWQGPRDSADFRALETYLKRVWFSSGIHHHYGCEKFAPQFSPAFLRTAMSEVDSSMLPLSVDAAGRRQTVDELYEELWPVIFDPSVMPQRVNKAQGVDLLETSACNFYQDVSQAEAEAFYASKKSGERDPMFGLNSTLVKRNGSLAEDVWTTEGKYGKALREVVRCLRSAAAYAENDLQRSVIDKLVRYYQTGNLRDFDDYSISWVECTDGQVDFVNGFIEVYGDPLGLKASWEGIVEYTDKEATSRAQLISANAQWFEDHSPVDARFRKPVVRGVSAHVICAAMLGGDEYPSTAIGINLPNSEWIRAEHGSKSVTISNITDAYNQAAHGNGFQEEFVVDEATLRMLECYGDECDTLHTTLHECLGHGSGRLLPGTDPDALKAYGNTIEEARADLFALYYIGDPKMVELGLLPDMQAHHASYYSYMMNGLLTQLIRIEPGQRIEEAHMRNRALIAHWCYERGCDAGIVSLEQREGKTFVRISDYDALRHLFAQLLAEVQRIRSEGDYEAARMLVESYGVAVDAQLHAEVRARYSKLHLAPYKGFLNPRLSLVRDGEGNICDVTVAYDETYTQQMLRYSRDYATLISPTVSPVVS